MKGNVLPYYKIKQLRKAASEGNQQAKAIIDKYMDNGDFSEIDSMVSAYYGNLYPKAGETPEEDNEYEWNSSDGLTEAKNAPTQKFEEKSVSEEDFPFEGESGGDANENEAETDKPRREAESPKPEQPKPMEAPKPTMEAKPTEEKPAPNPIEEIGEKKEWDFTSIDGEFDGLIDEDEISDVSFADFLKEKKKNANRERKNSDYFKAYGPEEREAFGLSKKDAFGKKFDGSRKKLERGYRDNGKALDEYSKIVTSFPMADGDIDVDASNKAYGEFTDDESAMGAFGRIWDEDDVRVITESLTALANKYGKKNVLSMLNSLRQDNESWKAFGDGKIENAIGNYGKSIDKLLK